MKAGTWQQTIDTAVGAEAEGSHLIHKQGANNENREMTCGFETSNPTPIERLPPSRPHLNLPR